MMPMLKTEKGWLIQTTPNQLRLILDACYHRRTTIVGQLLTFKLLDSTVESMRAEAKELSGMMDSIKASLKAEASAPPPDFTVEIELPLQVQL